VLSSREDCPTPASTFTHQLYPALPPRLHPCLPADELLEQFLESFPEETAQVQLQLMTATVKLFLKKPVEKPQQLIQLVLTYATQETDNPDLRDRAYIYWRLLSTDPGGWGWMGLGGRQTRPCGG
jgi:vesicle coat complex subunit